MLNFDNNALVVYVTVGDPDISMTRDIIIAAIDAEPTS